MMVFTEIVKKLKSSAMKWNDRQEGGLTFRWIFKAWMGVIKN